ncbi:MAG TPA: energy transducer TonB [Anditalea sp.]|nr:energy transducer TonB [Anditalea sp.]
MKSFLSILLFGAICYSPLLAQNFMDDKYQILDQFEEGKVHYILKPLNDSIYEILDLEENLVGREEIKIKQASNTPHLIRELSFYDEYENVIERHQLTDMNNHIRYSAYLNKDQQIIRQEQWKNGILSFRSYVDPITKVTKTDEIIYPGPIGGFDVWNKYLAQNLRYPKEAKQNKQSGTVDVTFDIDTNGNLININTSHSEEIHESLVKEAKRVISQFKGGWQPHEINGEAIISSLTIPIRFRVVFNQL